MKRQPNITILVCTAEMVKIHDVVVRNNDEAQPWQQIHTHFRLFIKLQANSGGLSILESCIITHIQIDLLGHVFIYDEGQ